MIKYSYMLGLSLIVWSISFHEVYANDHYKVADRKNISRNVFLTADYAGWLAQVQEFGSGRTQEEQAKKAEKFNVLKKNHCHFLSREDVNKNVVWYMINNGALSENIRGAAKIRVYARHYSYGITTDGQSRKLDHDNSYPTLREININPDIINADWKKRVVFFTTKSDLVEIDISAQRKDLKKVFDGKYFIVSNKNIIKDNLIPACRRNNILLGWFN
ncbi:hypothetical protein [uncultured Roseibium sp.]|uniref:hypothetical protein n=1 Tax=uncultured Roseibium sp. TaxID=1936171 RepID=UPI00260B9A5D|nr:hypothetical protein [uncultured Roseibium sp.]